ncbi:type II secretion system protein [Halanaerobium congolense]|uniref:type II secretion system protein n=1 Tax=Halanaerobium congolense TaxID=54121 RepID=UPI0009165057|nr:prepilin-type N-terminal cleavage/methylation domain-containing protein [Halanaerobium congolense]SHM24403.1 N-terminal methylation site-containing protein [Halanaerobium congolense]
MRKFREMIFSGGEKGFTLIELLVVIAVLGILAGIAVPRLTGVRDQAVYASGKSALGNLRTYVNIYFTEQDTDADLDTIVARYSPDTSVDDILNDGWSLSTPANATTAISSTTTDIVITNTTHTGINDLTVNLNSGEITEVTGD